MLINTISNITTILVKHYNYQINKWWWDEVKNNFLTHKIRHTYGVYFASQRIMLQNSYLGYNPFSDKLKYRVQVACLLHDIGRFYQLNEKSILNNEEFEHGDIWYNILLKEGIDDYGVLFAVKYHNKFTIDWVYNENEFQKMSEKQKQETLYLIKMVRDADKLENIEYVIYNQNKDLSKREETLLGRGVENNYISFVCLECLKNKKPINYKYLSTIADQIIVKAGWEFDINFEGTKKLIKIAKFKEYILDKLEKISTPKKEIDIVRNNIY